MPSGAHEVSHPDCDTERLPLTCELEGVVSSVFAALWDESVASWRRDARQRRPISQETKGKQTLAGISTISTSLSASVSTFIGSGDERCLPRAFCERRDAAGLGEDGGDGSRFRLAGDVGVEVRPFCGDDCVSFCLKKAAWMPSLRCATGSMNVAESLPTFPTSWSTG